MVNINLLLNHIKARLGASHKPIELSDEAIVQCLQENTLITLSTYFPFFCQYPLSQSERVDNQENLYFIPDEIHDFKTLAVELVIPSYVGSMGSAFQFTPLGGDIQAIIERMSSLRFANNLASIMTNPLTHTFIPPNMLRVMGHNIGNATGTSLMAVLRTTHRKDFTTLPFGALDIIKELAFYDVALDILSIRKYFSQINTNFAQIELDLDPLMVEDKRNNVLETLRRDMLKTANQRKVFIY